MNSTAATNTIGARRGRASGPSSAKLSAARELSATRARTRDEPGKLAVGPDAVIDELLVGLLSGGHCLLTGAPGLAKTLLIKSLARLFSLKFQRIQFRSEEHTSE